MFTTQDKTYLDKRFGHLDKKFATKQDLKHEIKTVKEEIKDLEIRIDKKFTKTEDRLILVIEAVGNTILKEVRHIGEKLDDQNDTVNNHERRIEKLEEKVYA